MKQRDWIISASIKEESRAKLRKLRDELANNTHKRNVLARAQLSESWDDIKRTSTRLIRVTQ